MDYPLIRGHTNGFPHDFTCPVCKKAAPQKVPDLRFELVECTQGVDSVAIYYESAMGKMVTKVMFLDLAGKVSKVIAQSN